MERQQHFLFNFNQIEADEDESQHLQPSNVNMFLFDEVNLINSERLILIQIYSNLIRIQTDKVQAESVATKKDSTSSRDS